jgi:hypothetical protein
MEMDRRFCEAFDRITRQVAAVFFLQFINAILYLPAQGFPGNQTGNCWAASAATSYPEDQRGRGAESPRAGPENRKRVDCSRPSDGVHVVPSKGTA